MDQLKFKAWHKKRKEILFGTAGSDGGLVFVKPVDMYVDSREEIGYRNIDLEILQFTGVIDSTGREIYEGDVVADETTRATEVRYNKENGSFEPLNEMNLNSIRIVESKYKLQLNN